MTYMFIIALLFMIGEAGVIVWLYKDRQTLSAELKKVQGEKVQLKANVEALQQNVNDIETIKKWQEGIDEQLKKAKSADDFKAIAASIIAHNNARVSDHK